MSPRAISALARSLSIFLIIASVLIPVMIFAFVTIGDSLELSLLGNADVEAAQARWLSEKSVAGFQRFAWANLALICYEVFGGAFLVTYIRLQQIPNQISFMFGLTTEFFTALFIALAILVVAHIFAAGKTAYEENQSFV